MNRTSRPPRAAGWLLVAAAGLAPALAATPARAQMAHLPDNDWRQADRHDTLAKRQQRANVFFELRFGPYLPSLASSGEKGAQAFNNVFGFDCGAPAGSSGSGKAAARFHFGLEVDVVPLRIPYVGAFGLGVGWGFTRFGALAQYKGTATAGTTTVNCSEQSTSLTIMPMHASLVLRVDELMRRTGIPIVPYGKAGIGLQWWRAATDTGTEQLCKASDGSYGPCTAGATADATGMGLTPSMHFAVGGMLSLSFIDPRATAGLSDSTGLGHVYLFGEFYSDALTLSPSKVMHVGATSWVAGLAVDM